jgi:hypothetical protein
MNPIAANVSRTRSGATDKNTLVLPKLSHISVLLRSNSGSVPIANSQYRIELADGSVLEGTTDEHGLIAHRNVPPGDYPLEIGGSFRTTVPTLPVHISQRTLRVPDYLLFEEDSYDDTEGLSSDEEIEEAEEVELQPLEDDEAWEDVSDG